MRKRFALIVSIMLTLAVLLLSLYQRPYDRLHERVIVSQVIDGDTLRLADSRVIRLINVNTPEKSERYYAEAKENLSWLINRSVELEILGIEKYGRTLGRVYAPEYLNLNLVKGGFAHSFLVNNEEIADFKDAQDYAFKNEIGIWKHSPYYECLKAEINKKDEYVDLVSGCKADVTGWVIQDESTKKYVLITNFKNIRLYSGDGKDNDEEIFWDVGSVWNNDRDSLFIRDKNGLLVYYNRYGY